MAAAIAKAFGYSVEDITLFRRSVKRSRMQGRVARAKLEEENFSPNGPLLLHWNGKLLPDIHGSKTRAVG